MSQIDIVVPDGSMKEVVTGLLARAGLPVTMEKERTKQGKIGAEWIKRVAFQRPQEIPHYLSQGHFDLAIVGEDWIANWGYEFPVLLKLPIGRGGNRPVKIVLAVSENNGINRPEDLPSGSEVATEYVQLVERYFKGLGRNDISVVPSFGNTEHKIAFGAAAVVDVTESGRSLRENGLKIIEEIMESNTVIVANSESLANKTKRCYIDYFVRLLKGAYQASLYVLMVANVPSETVVEASRIMGGLKGPTCSSLTTQDWFALQSVVRREKEHEVIFQLLQVGVTDIVVTRDIPLIMT